MCRARVVDLSPIYATLVVAAIYVHTVAAVLA